VRPALHPDQSKVQLALARCPELSHLKEFGLGFVLGAWCLLEHQHPEADPCPRSFGPQRRSTGARDGAGHASRARPAGGRDRDSPPGDHGHAEPGDTVRPSLPTAAPGGVSRDGGRHWVLNVTRGEEDRHNSKDNGPASRARRSQQLLKCDSPRRIPSRLNPPARLCYKRSCHFSELGTVPGYSPNSPVQPGSSYPLPWSIRRAIFY